MISTPSVIQSNFDVERNQLKKEISELKSKLASAYMVIDFLNQKVEKLSAPKGDNLEPSRVVKTERSEPVPPLEQLYTGFPIGVASNQQPAPVATHNSFTSTLKPATISSQPTLFRPEPQRQQPMAQIVTQLPAPQFPPRGETHERIKVLPLDIARSINPAVNATQNIQIMGQSHQLQTVTTSLHLQQQQESIPLPASRNTSSSQYIGSFSELQVVKPKSVQEQQTQTYPQVEGEHQTNRPTDDYHHRQSPEARSNSPRRKIFSTPDSKRSRSRSPPPGVLSNAAAKLKEANSRIRYLADENDKLVGRLRKFKITEEETKRREANLEKQVAFITQQKLEADNRAWLSAKTLQEEKEAAEALAKQLEELAAVATQKYEEAEQKSRREERKEKLRGVAIKFTEDNAIPEVLDDTASPINEPKVDEHPFELAAPKKKKKKKAKVEFTEDVPRDGTPVIAEPQPEADPESKPKKTKKKKAKATESEAPGDVVPPQPEVTPEESTVKKKKGTKKKKEE
jgi:hypothetical protein